MPVLKINIFLVTVNWSLRHLSGQSSYLLQRSQVIVLFWPVSFSKVLSALNFVKTYKVPLIQRDSFFTVTLAPLGSISYLLPCFVLWSDNCIIVKACSRNITDYATTPVYKEKINLKIWCAFLWRPTFVPWPRKVG